MVDEWFDVVIFGGGIVGWMVVVVLLKYYGNFVWICFVEFDCIGIVGVGEVIIFQIKIFNEVLGIDENEFFVEIGGFFKLGIEFINWCKCGEVYLYSFGQIGYLLVQVFFQYYWFCYKVGGGIVVFWDYCLNVVVVK